MSNEEMKAGRYLSMQRARRTYAAILDCFSKGGQVVVATYTRSTIYKSPEYFKLGKNDVYVRRGKSLDSITGCAIRFGYPR